jgi:DinB family protein
MRKLVTCGVVMLVLLTTRIGASPMTDGDRQRLLAHFEMTEGWLVSELAGLSPKQLTFKMTPDSWSITEVVEHLAIAEPQYWQQLLDAVKQPASADKGSTTDAAILWYGIDRTRRDKTGDARVPHGKYPDAKASLADFRKLRATMKTYGETTQEDLRGKRFGESDVYQWFLMISTHAQRHILQVREIKAHANYPKA